MITKVTAEFDSREAAEEVLGKIKNSIKGVYSAYLMQSRISSRSFSRKTGSLSAFMQNTGTLMSSAVNMPHNTFESSVSSQRRKTTVFIVYDNRCDRKIRSILDAMGGKNIN